MRWKLNRECVYYKERLSIFNESVETCNFNSYSIEKGLFKSKKILMPVMRILKLILTSIMTTKTVSKVLTSFFSLSKACFIFEIQLLPWHYYDQLHQSCRSFSAKSSYFAAVAKKNLKNRDGRPYKMKKFYSLHTYHNPPKATLKYR